MSARVDVLVVGAGPGGLVAAATAAEAGMRVCLVDDNPSAGGQIWRSGIEEQNRQSARLLGRLQEGRVETRFGWRAVAAPAPRVLRIEQSSQFADIQFTSLILATGARERYLPFPGWTLPGVYGAGGLQAFVKSGFDIRGKRVVVAGTGPLLLAVAAHLRAAGAQVVSVLEQAPMRRVARFSLGLMRGQAGKLIEGAGYAISTLGVPYRTGAWVTSASGNARLEKVTIRSGSRIREISCDMLAIGYHLVANTELAHLLGSEVEAGCVRVDELQQSSVTGIYCAGELTGTGGVDKAKTEGRIAAWAAIGQADRAGGFSKNAICRGISRANSRPHSACATNCGTWPPAPRLSAAARTCVTNACTCHSWREAKLHTRCGMGPCQGRICAPATEFVFGWNPPAPRPPLFPVEVDTFAQENQHQVQR